MLLDLASLIFEEQQSLEVLLRKIAATILSFMQAQECTIFISDAETSVSAISHISLLEYLEETFLQTTCISTNRNSINILNSMELETNKVYSNLLKGCFKHQYTITFLCYSCTLPHRHIAQMISSTYVKKQPK